MPNKNKGKEKSPLQKGFKNNLTNQLLMNNYKPNKNNSQSNSPQSRRSLLEQSKLSQFPKRKFFSLDKIPFAKAACVFLDCAGCGARLEQDNDFLQSVHCCGKCIGIYARVDAAINEIVERKKREELKKFMGGAK